SVGRQLSDVALMPDGHTLLVTDKASHELLIVRATRERVEVVERLPVARYPVHVAVSDDGRMVAVAGLWSRRITLLRVEPRKADAEDAGGQSPFRSFATLRLPFPPRLQLFVDERRRLLVADAFGGRLAII